MNQKLTKATALRKTSKRTKLDRRTLTAYHEAGHALAHYLFMIPYLGVSIIPDATHYGRVVREQTYICNGDLTDREIEEMIISDFCGMAAESRISGRVLWRSYGSGDFNSAFNTMALFADISRDEYVHYMRYLWARANVLMKRPGHWEGVELVVSELLNVGNLSAERISEIFVGTVGHGHHTAAPHEPGGLPSEDRRNDLSRALLIQSLRGWWHRRKAS